MLQAALLIHTAEGIPLHTDSLQCESFLSVKPVDHLQRQFPMKVGFK